MKKHKAFSLIELSIVVLVIGILIAGVIQGSNLLAKFRIKAAQTLTQSSPVNSIKDLAAWYETTSDKSFISSEAQNSLPITVWKDINSQSAFMNDATAPSLKNATYIENAQNGLPVLRFSNSYYTNSTLKLGGEMSTFAVVNTNQSGYAGIINAQANFFVGVGGSTKRFAVFYGNNSDWNTVSTFGITSELVSNKYYVLSAILKDGTNSGYVNGVNVGSGATGKKSDSNLIYIGRHSTVDFQYYSGDMGEIIVFNRGLNTEERKAVEKYLGQKWGIKVSS
jgi:prepilin-type N-terminal cleavage/methylation domain-containing protein